MRKKLLPTFILPSLMISTFWLAPSIFAHINDTPEIAGPSSIYVPNNIDPMPDLKVTGYTSINQTSQTLLADHHSHKRMPPASLTKLMTLLIAYDYIDKGLIQPNENVFISKKAWKTEGSRMFLEPESYEPVDLLLKGISVVSGNDASVAIAEHIAGNERSFAKLMNDKAKELNLRDTHFENSTGLPSKHHYSSPYDMSILAMHLTKKYPQILAHTKEKTMVYKNIKQYNRNRLLWKDESVFGLKTGHTNEAGYCLVVAAVKNNQTIVATVFGAKSENSRDAAVSKLLNHAQNRFKNIEITNHTQLPKVRIWYSQETYVSPQLQAPVYLSIPENAKQEIQTKADLKKDILAPLKKGEAVGTYKVYIDNKLYTEVPIITSKDIPTQSTARQVLEWIVFQFYHLSNLLFTQKS